MKKHLVLLSVAVSLLAGCGSQIGTGVATSPPVGLDYSPNALQQETAALQQAFQQLQESHARIVEEHKRAIEQSQQLAAEHALVMARVNEITQEVNQLYRTVAETTRSPLPGNWHQRLIEQNRSAYVDIQKMLSGLKEAEFPTVRTWYGAKWSELTKPFLENRFPTELQRDQLVSLLEEIIAAERKRMMAMEVQAVTPVAIGQTAELTGIGLGPRWEKLSSDLRSLRY